MAGLSWNVALLRKLCVFRNGQRVYSLARYRKLRHTSTKRCGFPPEFQSLLKEWPKILQWEITEQNKQVDEVFGTSGGDWTSLEDQGLSIGPLSVTSDTLTPLRGRIIVLKKDHIIHDRQLYSPPKTKRQNCFRSGAPVALYEKNSLRLVSEAICLEPVDGDVVLKLRDISRTFDKSLQFIVVPSRDTGAVHSLQKLLRTDFAQASAGHSLLQYAFRAQPMPSVHNDRIPFGISEELNDSQRRAVAAALNKKRPFVCIQGPPGTGKTHVVAEIVRLLVRDNKKVLVCAPSNVAVDNALQKTADLIQRHSTDNLTDSFGLAECTEDALRSHVNYDLLSEMSTQLTCSKLETEQERELRRKFRTLKAKMRKQIYKQRNVIFCTVSSNVVQNLEKSHWYPDVVIIDEAAQCSQPSSWAAIVKAPRCVLVGDHAQLPPVVLSDKARKAKFSLSLMERMCVDFPHSNLVHLLSTQYRMNESIMKWSSDYFYESRLVAEKKVASRRLSDHTNVPEYHAINTPLIMIDTDGKDARNIPHQRNRFHEEPYQRSYRNIGEAELVANYVQTLLSHGVHPSSIGIISPYYGQVEYLRNIMSRDELTINSVDAFQGQERNVIILSMVRNNRKGVIGFLQDVRRLNVAVTRARCQFVLCGSARMMQSDAKLNTLYTSIRKFGRVFTDAVE